MLDTLDKLLCDGKCWGATPSLNRFCHSISMDSEVSGVYIWPGLRVESKGISSTGRGFTHIKSGFSIRHFKFESCSCF